MRQDYGHYFVFDVETVGLFGPPFAFGYIVCDKTGVELESNGFWVNLFQPGTLQAYKSSWTFTDNDVEWITKNVLPPVRAEEQNALHEVQTMSELLMQFWKIWDWCKDHYDDIVMVADCPFPVETNFVGAVLTLLNKANMDNSPYPFLDVASMLLARSLDPLANYRRYEDEKPEHNPLADARQSARLLMGVMGHTPRANNKDELVQPTHAKNGGEHA